MKIWIKKIVGFGTASFLSDFSHEMTISFVPVLVTQFVGPELAPFFMGIISSIIDSFTSFLRIISGYVSDRLAHKKPLIAIGYFLSGFFSMLVGFAQSVWGILVYRMLSFTGSGLREPPRDALIAASVEPRDYGKAFGLKSAMDTLGALLGPLVAFILTGKVSIPTIFLLSFIPGILSVLAILFLTEDIPVKPHTKKYTPLTFWQSLQQLPTKFILLLFIFFIFDLVSFNKLLLLSRAQQMLSGTTNVTQLLVLLYACFNIFRSISEYSIGYISDYSNRIVLFAFLGCGALSIGALLLTVSHASLLFCIFIFLLFAISTAAKTTLKKAAAADMLPQSITGLGYGTLQASEGIAALIGNFFIGLIWTKNSALLAFSLVATMSIVAMLLLIGFSFATRAQKS